MYDRVLFELDVSMGSIMYSSTTGLCTVAQVYIPCPVSCVLCPVTSSYLLCLITSFVAHCIRRVTSTLLKRGASVGRVNSLGTRYNPHIPLTTTHPNIYTQLLTQLCGILLFKHIHSYLFGLKRIIFIFLSLSAVFSKFPGLLHRMCGDVSRWARPHRRALLQFPLQLWSPRSESLSFAHFLS